MKWLTALLGVAFVSACTLVPATEESTTSPAPAPSSTSDCEPAVREQVEGAIRAQQQAFSGLDFDRARSFASDSFRSDVTTVDFTYIIRRDYPFLLGDPTITFEACVQVNEVAVIRVVVQGLQADESMVYRLVLENEGWFIDGARLSQDGPLVTA